MIAAEEKKWTSRIVRSSLRVGGWRAEQSNSATAAPLSPRRLYLKVLNFCLFVIRFVV